MQTLIYKIFNKLSVQFYVDWALSFFAVQRQELVLPPAGAGEKKSGMLPTWRRCKISACGYRREYFLSGSQLQWQRRCNLVHDEGKGGVCVCARAGGTLEEHTPVQTEVMRLPLRVSELSLHSAEGPASTVAGCDSARSASMTLVCISVTDRPQTTGSFGEPLTSLLYVSAVRVQG